MARVTDSGVKTILDTAIDTTPFITAANLLIDYHLAGVLSEALLTEIERFYAAWLACGRDPRAQSVRTDDTTVVYQEGAAKDFFLERALALDPTGRLRLAGTARPATVTFH